MIRTYRPFLEFRGFMRASETCGRIATPPSRQLEERVGAMYTHVFTREPKKDNRERLPCAPATRMVMESSKCVISLVIK
jgi:hypothetical protein